MAVGTSERFSMYVVRHADDTGGPGASDFRDYSGEFLKWSYKSNISQVGFFEGVLVQRENASDLATQKLDFASGNILYVLSGQTLICKIVIDRSEFKDDYTIIVKGYQSTGSEIDLRKLLSETTGKGNYKDTPIEDIYDDLFEDVLPLGTFDSVNVSFKYDYQNKIQALTKLSVQGHMEWNITYGANDATPFSSGDEVELSERIGSTSSVYTFNLTGSDINATFSAGDEDKDSLINEVIVKGTIQGGIQSQAHMFDSTGVVTYISNGSWDSWLYEAVDGGIDVINVNSGVPGGGNYRVGEKIRGLTSSREAVIVKEYTAGSVYSIDYTSDPDATTTKDPRGFIVGETLRGLTSGITNSFSSWRPSNIGPLIIKIKKGSQMQYASDGYIKIDAERMDFNAVVTSDPNYDLLRIRGMNRSGGLQFGRGQAYMGTKATPHAVGADVVYLARSNTGTPSPYYMSVEDASAFPSSGNILIGTEWTAYSSKVGDNLFINGRDFFDSYAHSNGMRVQRRYLPASPDTSTSNSIATNGIKSATVSENYGGTRDALDRKAMSIIENKSEVMRIQINASDYFDAFDTIALGDRVTLNGATAINMADGAGYRVMGFEYSFDYGEVNLIYYLNTNDTRTWASTDFTYVDATEEADQDRKQEAARTSDNERATETTGIGSDNQWTTTPGLIRNVADPSDSYDAVNKKYVDQVAASGGATADEKVKVTSSDTTTNYLFSKVIAGTGITFVVVNPGGNEQLQINSSTASTYWARDTSVAPYLYPLTAGDDVCPNNPANSYLGQQGLEWGRVYSQSLRTHNSSMYIDTIYAGTSTHYIRNLETGQVTRLSIEGDTFPATDGTFDLGTVSNRWDTAYIETIYCDKLNVNGSTVPETFHVDGTVSVTGNVLFENNFEVENDVILNSSSSDNTDIYGILACYADANFWNQTWCHSTFAAYGAADFYDTVYHHDDVYAYVDDLSMGTQNYPWRYFYCDDEIRFCGQGSLTGSDYNIEVTNSGNLYIDLASDYAMRIYASSKDVKFYGDIDTDYDLDVGSGNAVGTTAVNLRNLPSGSYTALMASGTGRVYLSSSSKEFKKDIVPLEVNTKKVYELTPVSFTWKENNSRDFGLIAEDVAAIIPELVCFQNGKPFSVKYAQLAVLLLKELKTIKENQEKILSKIGGI
jgi:Chaperone of endosialidase